MLPANLHYTTPNPNIASLSNGVLKARLPAKRIMPNAVDVTCYTLAYHLTSMMLMVLMWSGKKCMSGSL